jgi:hypothetical protein
MFLLVRFQVLIVVGMKVTVLWYVAPYSLVETDVYCLRYHPDDDGSRHL